MNYDSWGLSSNQRDIINNIRQHGYNKNSSRKMQSKSHSKLRRKREIKHDENDDIPFDMNQILHSKPALRISSPTNLQLLKDKSHHDGEDDKSIHDHHSVVSDITDITYPVELPRETYDDIVIKLDNSLNKIKIHRDPNEHLVKAVNMWLGTELSNELKLKIHMLQTQAIHVGTFDTPRYCGYANLYVKEYSASLSVPPTADTDDQLNGNIIDIYTRMNYVPFPDSPEFRSTLENSSGYFRGRLDWLIDDEISYSIVYQLLSNKLFLTYFRIASIEFHSNLLHLIKDFLDIRLLSYGEDWVDYIYCLLDFLQSPLLDRFLPARLSPIIDLYEWEYHVTFPLTQFISIPFISTFTSTCEIILRSYLNKSMVRFVVGDSCPFPEVEGVSGNSPYFIQALDDIFRHIHPCVNLMARDEQSGDTSILLHDTHQILLKEQESFDPSMYDDVTLVLCQQRAELLDQGFPQSDQIQLSDWQEIQESEGENGTSSSTLSLCTVIRLIAWEGNIRVRCEMKFIKFWPFWAQLRVDQDMELVSLYVRSTHEQFRNGGTATIPLLPTDWQLDRGPTHGLSLESIISSNLVNELIELIQCKLTVAFYQQVNSHKIKLKLYLLGDAISWDEIHVKWPDELHI